MALGADTCRGTYTPITGSGSLSLTAGIWDLGTVFPNTDETLFIAVSIDLGTNGATLMNAAEVLASDNFDPDSVPSNNLSYEDDQDKASLVMRVIIRGKQGGARALLRRHNKNERKPRRH